MRTPFARPLFATLFYIGAGLMAVVAVLVGVSLALGGTWILGRSFAAVATGYGFIIFVTIMIQAVCAAAIGYVIELLAKIEWNTRPNTAEVSYVAEPARATASSSINKQYFLSEKGRVTGPLNGAEILALYRNGKISNAAQVAVEENGQRRLLKNLSEIPIRCGADRGSEVA